MAGGSLWMRLGLTHHRFIDEGFAHDRIKYTGTTFSGSIGYRYTAPEYYWEIEATGGSGNTSAYGYWPDARVIRIYLAATYTRQVYEYRLFNAPGRLLIGGQIASSHYVIENTDDLEEATLNNYHSVNLVLSGQTRISERSHLEIQVSLPLAGFSRRTNYDGGINQEVEEQYENNPMKLLFSDGSFSFFNPLDLPSLKIEFLNRIGSATDMAIGYRLDYLRNPDPPPVRLYSNTLSFGFRFYLRPPQ